MVLPTHDWLVHPMNHKSVKAYLRRRRLLLGGGSIGAAVCSALRGTASSLPGNSDQLARLFPSISASDGSASKQAPFCAAWGRPQLSE